MVESSLKINTNIGLFRVLIADDHEVVRRGVRVLLKSPAGKSAVKLLMARMQLKKLKNLGRT